MRWTVALSGFWLNPLRNWTVLWLRNCHTATMSLLLNWPSFISSSTLPTAVYCDFHLHTSLMHLAPFQATNTEDTVTACWRGSRLYAAERYFASEFTELPILLSSTSVNSRGRAPTLKLTPISMVTEADIEGQAALAQSCSAAKAQIVHHHCFMGQCVCLCVCFCVCGTVGHGRGCWDNWPSRKTVWSNAPAIDCITFKSELI